MKILLIEDNPLHVQAAIDQLSGHEITVFNNWKQFSNFGDFNGCPSAEKLLKFFKEYDMVLTDINMPVMDGIELTKQIRRHPNPKIQSLPVIVLTGSNLKEATERIKEVGVTDFLLKPFSQNDFVEMIRRNLIKH